MGEGSGANCHQQRDFDGLVFGGIEGAEADFAHRETFELCVQGAVWLGVLLFELTVVVGTVPAVDGDEGVGVSGGGEEVGAPVAGRLGEESGPVSIGFIGGDECFGVFGAGDEFPEDKVHGGTPK